MGSTYTCSKIRLTKNVFPLTPALTLTLKHNNVFGLNTDTDKNTELEIRSTDMGHVDLYSALYEKKKHYYISALLQ